MKGQKAKVLTIAEKCKNILASNWQGNLNTIKADSTGSKKDIHTSKVKFMFTKGKPYLWVPEDDLHNVNAVIDERASLAVASHFPGPLASLLRSMKKLPARVALTGQLIPLEDDKVLSAAKYLRETAMFEQKVLAESSYAVSEVLKSASGSGSWSENLREVLNTDQSYSVYKFQPSSCIFIGGNGGTHDVDFEDLQLSEPDEISTFAAKLIDGINKSEMRRRALVIFCHVYMGINVRNAYVQWVDRKGFDVLGKITKSTGDHQWKEFRFTFKEEADGVESFCHRLVEMEEDAMENLKSVGGLG